MVDFPTISDLVLRIESDETVGGLQEADTSYPENGENVIRWNDASTGGNDWTVAGGDPTLATGDPGTKGSVNLDGVGDELELENDVPMDTLINTNTNSGWTVFVVFKQNANGGDFFILNMQGGGNVTLYEESGGGAVWWGAGAGNKHVVLAAADTDWHMFTGVHRGDATSTSRIDGGATVTGTGDAGAGSSPFLAMFLGSNNGGFIANLNLAAVIVYDKALSEAEVQEVEYYLDQTYGLGNGIPNPAATDSGMSMGIGIFPHDG